MNYWRLLVAEWRCFYIENLYIRYSYSKTGFPERYNIREKTKIRSSLQEQKERTQRRLLLVKDGSWNTFRNHSKTRYKLPSCPCRAFYSQTCDFCLSSPQPGTPEVCQTRIDNNFQGSHFVAIPKKGTFAAFTKVGRFLPASVAQSLPVYLPEVCLNDVIQSENIAKSKRKDLKCFQRFSQKLGE